MVNTRLFMAIRHVFLLAIVLLTSCSPSWTRAPAGAPEGPVDVELICIDLPAPQQPEAAAAVNGWNKALNRWKQLTVIVGRDSSCRYVVHEVDPGSSDDPATLAWTSAIGEGDISMVKGKYERDTMGILMHELGHAFGAQHVPGTLMNATWFRHGYSCPDVATVAQVAAWNKVDIRLFTWCYW